MNSQLKVTKAYNAENFSSFLFSFLPIDLEMRREEKIDKGSFISLFKLGDCPSLNLAIYEAGHDKKTDPRISFTREIIKHAKRYETHPNLLVVFHNPESAVWRFSLITSDYVYDEKTNKVTTEYSNPRRFSFILGEGCKLHTPSVMLFDKGRVKDNEDLISRFAVEVVTKEFYTSLFDWYTWAVEVSKFPEGSTGDVVLSNADNNQHIIRLITRIMFIWFIKQLELIPEWIFDERKLENILNDFKPKSIKQGNYYNAILQNLFFATLNKEISTRAFTNTENPQEHFGIKTLYRDSNNSSYFSISHDEVLDLFSSVPFLNGGLFECLDKLEDNSTDTQVYCDGFSRKESHCAIVPNALFWNTEQDGNQGLFELLNRYNFTVEENTPTDIQIALDPEMLGKVFENLLGTYNPETQETARNASGSFYTPREIVNFMVDSSLEAYLLTELPNHSEASIKVLFDDFVERLQIEDKYKAEIIETLKNCKILDPACGSGAFPMGILNRMVTILLKVDYNPDEINSHENLKYLIKKELIEKCIYGSDIQPIAVQIAKLRFFISLVCEQEKIDDPSINYGITPLPNLETKFVAANSLFSLPKKSQEALDIADESLITLKEKLSQIRLQHFTAKTAKEKRELRGKDAKIRNSIIRRLAKVTSAPNPELITKYETEINNLKRMKENLSVAEEVEFITLFGTKEIDKQNPHVAELKIVQNTLNEIENKLEIEQNKGKSDGLINHPQDLVKWNPYDQNAVSNFFDPQWMFGEKVKQGFDIVIGNPPYIHVSLEQIYTINDL